jgi:hypothetical protein
MRARLNVSSLTLGLLLGCGLTLLIAAKGNDPASHAATTADNRPVGRYQLRTISRDGGGTACVLDTVTGEICMLSDSGAGGNVFQPQWHR